MINEFNFYTKGSVRESELEILKKYAKLSKNNIIEIGSFQGRTTIELCKHTKMGNDCDVYAVDTWNGKKVDEGVFLDKKTFIENINKSGFINKVKIIHDSSKNVLKNWDLKIGLLFIDGNHSYKGVKEDINWVKHVIDGGYIIFHDYSPNYKDRVVKAVDELIKSKNYNIIEIVDSLIVIKNKV